jgi:hypothetical protein
LILIFNKQLAAKEIRDKARDKRDLIRIENDQEQLADFVRKTRFKDLSCFAIEKIVDQNLLRTLVCV